MIIVSINDKQANAELTCNHPPSQYNDPVLVIDMIAYSPMDIAFQKFKIIQVNKTEKRALQRWGYM